MLSPVDFHLERTRDGQEFPLRFDPCLNFPRLASAGVFGVIDMTLLSVIRRWAFRDQLSIQEISRRTRQHRYNKVRETVQTSGTNSEERTTLAYPVDTHTH